MERGKKSLRMWGNFFKYHKNKKFAIRFSQNSRRGKVTELKKKKKIPIQFDDRQRAAT